jgi:hypothetical protein
MMQPLAPAAAAHNLAVVIAICLAGNHPFAADTMVEHLTKIATSQPSLAGERSARN